MHFSVLCLLISTSAALFDRFFSKPTPKYNEQEAKMYMNLAAAAYGETPSDCIYNAFPAAEKRQLINLMKVSCDRISSLCSGYIVKSDVLKELTFVFRGTKTQSQLLLEGWSTLKPQKDFYGIGLVNEYFMRAHNLLWDPVGAVLNDTAYKNYNVVFTGHSLGGALAALAAARTASQGLRSGDKIRIITFGEPRVGNVVFARNFDKMIPNSFRVVFRKDIVPHTPGCVKDQVNGTYGEEDSKPCDPDNLQRSYHHSTEIWYPECMEQGCEYRVCTGQPQGEDFSCSDRLKFDLGEGASYIWDHRNYFGLMVTEYGKVGCDASNPRSQSSEPDGSSLTDKLFSALDWAGDVLGITSRKRSM